MRKSNENPRDGLKNLRKKGKHWIVVSAALGTIGALTLVNNFDQFTSSHIAKAETTAKKTELRNINTYVNPILQQYKVSDQSKNWQITSTSRVVLTNDDINRSNKRLQEVVKLVNSEYKASTGQELGMAFIKEGQQKATDILVKLVPLSSVAPNSPTDEAYKVKISDKGLVVEAASENAAMYALRTIQTINKTRGSLAYGEIVDYPNTIQRKLHVDLARKFISKDWFLREIREMSKLKFNTLQFHFSENLGFRIENETDPAVVSEQHLTKQEVREIIAEAKKYGIEIIPSFDTPGHLDQVLKAHPEFGQIGVDGKHSKSGLDITNPKAVEYIKSLYKEYFELFKDSKSWHIGADEYMEFDRDPFFSNYEPILTKYAQEKYGKDYNWQDAMAGYIKDMAEFVHDNGFKPIAWNDGLFYNDNGTQDGNHAQRQKIELPSYLSVDYWSNMPWNPSIASVEALKKHGITDINNLHSGFFYYVLRPGDKPTDGRETHSFDVLNQYRNIYNNWSLGNFPGSKLSDLDPVIKGTGIAIWCDKADVADEDTIMKDIEPEMQALSSKAWNSQTSQIENYDTFNEISEEMGHIPGYKKGEKLPQVGEFVIDNSTSRPEKPEPEKPNNGIEKLSTTGVVNYVPGYHVLLTDGNGNIQRQNLKHGTHWKVNAKKVINGEVFYRLGSDKQWIPAKYLLLNGEKQTMKKVATVKYKKGASVLLANGDGSVPTVSKRQFVKHGSKWKVFAVKAINGNLYYCLGSDSQWIPGKYLQF